MMKSLPSVIQLPPMMWRGGEGGRNNDMHTDIPVE